jgi:hypothetical protein
VEMSGRDLNDMAEEYLLFAEATILELFAPLSVPSSPQSLFLVEEILDLHIPSPFRRTALHRNRVTVNDDAYGGFMGEHDYQNVQNMFRELSGYDADVDQLADLWPQVVFLNGVDDSFDVEGSTRSY